MSSQACGTCLRHSASCAPGLGQVHALEAHVYLEVSRKYVPQSKYVCLKASMCASKRAQPPGGMASASGMFPHSASGEFEAPAAQIYPYYTQTQRPTLVLDHHHHHHLFILAL